MFDISALKEMKLVELQEIAKLAKTIKVTGAKKDTLIAEILEHQNKSVAAEPKAVADKPADNKTKRARIAPETKKTTETNQNDLFAEEKVADSNVNEQAEQKPAFQNKNPKFKKPVFEKKTRGEANNDTSDEQQPTESDIEVVEHNVSEPTEQNPNAEEVQANPNPF